jgi:hypothetical protein
MVRMALLRSECAFSTATLPATLPAPMLDCGGIGRYHMFIQ